MRLLSVSKVSEIRSQYFHLTYLDACWSAAVIDGRVRPQSHCWISPCPTSSASPLVSNQQIGTCPSVVQFLRFAAPLTARPATFIATLRGEIGSVSSPLRYAVKPPNSLPPSRTVNTGAVTVSSQSAHPGGDPGLTVCTPCLSSPSGSPRGGHNSSERQTASATAGAPHPRTLT